jgi:hypothetical protein
MTLWRVDVCGISHRYVAAESKEDAADQVRDALIAAIDLHADKADASISRAFSKAGPVQKRGMLARLDGLTNPRERRSAKGTKRRLERALERAEAEQAWIEDALGSAPPLSPEVVDRLVTLLEVRHVEESFDRLPSWDRQPPIYGK